jgi:ATP-binding cassette subfamily B protein
MAHHGNWWRYIAHDPKRDRPRITRQMLGRVARYARSYWRAVAMSLLIIAVISLIELIPPLLYRELIDNVLPNQQWDRLNMLALAMIAIPISSGLLGVAQRYFNSRVGEGIIYDLRQELYSHLQRMSLRFFTHTKSGDIISRLNNDVVGAQGAIVNTIPNLLTNIFTLTSTLLVMLTIEWRLTLLAIAVLPLFILPARRVGLVLRQIRRRSMELNADMSSAISETLSVNGALLVKTFGRGRYEVERFDNTNQEVRDIGIRQAMVGRWFFLGMSISGALGTALIYWVGGRFVLEDVISVGTIVAFAAYLGRLYGPISSLANVPVEFARALVSFERVFEYLDMPVEIADKADAVVLAEVQGDIRFENVSFVYVAPDSQPNPTPNGTSAQSSVVNLQSPASSRLMALQALNFQVAPGELVALVGPSGAGKTTITYLLPRLYDPTEGRVLLDGHDLRDVTLESLAGQIGMVTQETYLLHDTFAANLRYAKQDATQADMEAACKAANIHDFIAGLSDGYETLVGERGYRLSGGEKQRLAIARVILKNPRILILDEATAHLDSQSEALIQAALEPLFAGRTSFVIAHRLSTILAADKILVMDDGQVVEQGTHAELQALGGLYADLYRTQFRERQLAGDSMQ